MSVTDIIFAVDRPSSSQKITSNDSKKINLLGSLRIYRIAYSTFLCAFNTLSVGSSNK